MSGAASGGATTGPGRILLTGAFGNLGLACLEEALALGHGVRCFDVDTRRSRALARRIAGRAEVVLGDIRDTSLLPRLVDGVDAILHNASVLPPVTDDRPELAHAINVDATRRLITAAEGAGRPVFVFPSSVTVFGAAQPAEAPRTLSDPVEATDGYTAHKLEVEAALGASRLPWAVLRVGVSVDARTLSTDLRTFRRLLAVRADNPLEWIHPTDVARAMCRAAVTPAAHHRVHLIGGGPRCQVTHRDFLGAALGALGLRPPAPRGGEPYYTHWMDTAESERLLAYQRRSFDDYRREMAARLAVPRRLLWPVRWLANGVLAWLR